jgi:hypothetical protein
MNLAAIAPRERVIRPQILVLDALKFSDLSGTRHLAALNETIMHFRPLFRSLGKIINEQ